MVPDTIRLSRETAEALSTIGLGDFHEVELPERMAFVVLVLEALGDDPRWFPKGKWGTIHAIRDQLNLAADLIARQIDPLPAERALADDARRR